MHRGRGSGWLLVVAVFAVMVHPEASVAEGMLISGGHVSDMVFSLERQTVYMTSPNAVQRFHLGRTEFLEPYSVPDEGTRLMGLALSPDESVLVVADANRSATDVWVHLIDLNTDDGVTQPFPAAPDEAGTYAIAFAKNGTAFITSRSQRGREGRVPIRRLNPRTGEWDVFLADAPNETMVSASADGSVIGFAGTVESDGPFGAGLLGRIRIEDGDVAKVERPQAAWDIAVNADGTQFTLPGVPTAMVYDETLAEVGPPADPDENRTIGAAYHPSAPFVYVAPDRGKLLRAFDSRSLGSAGIYLMKEEIRADVGRGFETGRLRVTQDGSLLMCTVANGLWLAPVDNTPWAPDQTLATAADTPVVVRLTGSTAADAELTYQIDTQPEHGTLTGTMGDLRYVPDLGYAGTDRFSYRAHNGQLVSAAATISIEVGGTGAVASTEPAAPTEAREPAPGDGTVQAWALIYGCAEYPDGEADDLWLVPCNVNQVGITFHERLGIPWENMTVRCDEVGVTNDEVTPDLVKGDIARLAGIADGDDIVAIYYCGHGGSTDNTGRGTEYLALSTGPLYDHELKKALDELPCRNVVVVLDTCFSGGFAMSPDGLTGECASLDPNHAVYVVAACERTRSATGYSFLTDLPWLGATVFTPLFCEAMEGGMPAWKRAKLWPRSRGVPETSDGDGDGTITLLEAFTYAHDTCRLVSSAMGQQQIPVMRPEIPRQVADLGLARPLSAEVLASMEPWLNISFTGQEAQRTADGVALTIFGAVTDLHGTPVPGIRLMVSDALVDGDRPTMLTNADGVFSYHSTSNKPHGPYIFFTFWCPGADGKMYPIDGRTYQRVKVGPVR